MQDLGLTGILLDLDDPQSVERAAAEVIALTDNRLYGLFNNAGYGVYGPLNTISRQQMEQQFSANFFGCASAHHAATAGDDAARRRAHRDDILGDGAYRQSRPRSLCRQ